METAAAERTGEAGIDVNRNFPEGWFNDEPDGKQGGSGYYAASSPEARAILEFFTNNTNILLVQSFHTSGGFTYRPFARWPDSRIAAEDLAVFDQVMGPKYKELHPDEENPDRLWLPPYRGDRPYGYGIFIDWAYAQFGAYSMTTELWSWSRDTRGLPGYDGEADRDVWYRALLDYQESAFDGEIFVPWRDYNHPELGRGQIGGWVATYVGGNALPGPSLEHVADVHWQFELFKAGLLPKLEITEATAETLSSSGEYQGREGDGNRDEHGSARHSTVRRRAPRRKPTGRHLAPRRSRQREVPAGRGLAEPGGHRRNHGDPRRRRSCGGCQGGRCRWTTSRPTGWPTADADDAAVPGKGWGRPTGRSPDGEYPGGDLARLHRGQLPAEAGAHLAKGWHQSS